MYRGGMAMREIGAVFNLTRPAVSYILDQNGARLPEEKRHSRMLEGNARRTERRHDDVDRLSYRMRYLPEQLENTRRKLAALENEARRYGLTDLLETTQ
jgi:hypothetical protein